LICYSSIFGQNRERNYIACFYDCNP